MLPAINETHVRQCKKLLETAIAHGTTVHSLEELEKLISLLTEIEKDIDEFMERIMVEELIDQFMKQIIAQEQRVQAPKTPTMPRTKKQCFIKPKAPKGKKKKPKKKPMTPAERKRKSRAKKKEAGDKSELLANRLRNRQRRKTQRKITKTQRKITKWRQFQRQKPSLQWIETTSLVMESDGGIENGIELCSNWSW